LADFYKFGILTENKNACQLFYFPQEGLREILIFVSKFPFDLYPNKAQGLEKDIEMVFV